MFDNLYAAIDQVLQGNFRKAGEKLMPVSEAKAAFIGPKGMANLGALNRLNEAKELERQGAYREDVANKTGVWRGRDNIPRMEISDIPMKFKQPDPRKSWSGPLSDFIDHPELFKAYPHLKTLPVYVSPSQQYGVYTNSTDPDIESWMTLGGQYPNMRDLIMHEIQHAIQQNEGFFPEMNDPKYRAFPTNEDEYKLYRNRPWENEARTVGSRATAPLPNVQPWEY